MKQVGHTFRGCVCAVERYIHAEDQEALYVTNAIGEKNRITFAYLSFAPPARLFSTEEI